MTARVLSMRGVLVPVVIVIVIVIVIVAPLLPQTTEETPRSLAQ